MPNYRGRLGRGGGDKKSMEGLVCMHISITNGHKTLGGEDMHGSGVGRAMVR